MTWTFHVTVMDDESHTSVVSFNFPDTILTSNMTAIAGALGTALEPLLDGVITKVSVVRTLVTFVDSPVSGADIEIAANFLWGVAGSVKRTLQKLPSFKRTLLIPTTKNVDIADADVAAFIDFMVDGATIGGVLTQPTNDIGTDIAALTSAKETYSKARKDK